MKSETKQKNLYYGTRSVPLLFGRYSTTTKYEQFNSFTYMMIFILCLHLFSGDQHNNYHSLIKPINCEEDYDFVSNQEQTGNYNYNATTTKTPPEKIELFSQHYSNHHLVQPENLDYIFRFDDNSRYKEDDTFESLPTSWPSEQTPPLDIFSGRYKEHEIKLEKSQKQVRGSGRRRRERETEVEQNEQRISPSRVYTRVERFTYGPYENNYHQNSPIFNLQSLSANPVLFNNIIQPPAPNAQSSAQYESMSSNSDGSNAFDLIEGSGVGAGYDQQPPDSNGGLILEDSTTIGDNQNFNIFEPTNSLIKPNQVNTPKFNMNVGATQSWHAVSTNNDPSDRPPVLNRRLPKLVATAGQVWKYFVPKETFLDEDGDLAQLKTMVVPKMPPGGESYNNNINSNDRMGSRDYIGQFNSWLQYDATNQLLYGFPTDDQIGKHEYYLLVSDRWGQTSNESVEIHVRQHQSSRAFTHLILMNQVRWNSQKYRTLVDALGEFVRKMTAQVFNDQTPYRNFVARYYTLEPVATMANPLDEPGENFNSSFTVAWSNASVPVHSCNLSFIDNMSKFLIDIPTQQQQDNSNSNNDNNTNNIINNNNNNGAIQYEPASNLIRALDYEFKPTSVSIFLQGACEGKEPHQSGNELYTNSSAADQLPVRQIDNNVSGNFLRVRIKIGKLSWKLGEPFEYQIPNETFEMGNNLVTRDLQLTLHTIDGLTFDTNLEHNFLQFDQDTQTLYGAPYSLEHHVGLRELQLTGRNLKDGQKVHEVFVLNIEPKDLTTINNRAFRMSLYVSTRTGVFGPKERVGLMYKIGRALDGSEVSTSNNNQQQHQREDSEFIVIDIQKFALAAKSLNQHQSSISGSRITRVVDNSSYSFPSDNLINPMTPDSSFADHSAYGQQSYMYKYTWTDERIGNRGDCPVEVIKENIIIALERVMMEYNFPEASMRLIDDDPNKNASEKFYERLKLFFEPDLNLIHLRFEPLNACVDALELHDVGDMELADQADKASDYMDEFEPQLLTTVAPVVSPDGQHPAKHQIPEINNDEYWSIIVLIILVFALLFVMLMFLLAMRTYRINQDKRFELQVRLAQARQNSMYLSSMMLAEQANTNDIQRMIRPSPSKSMYIIQDEEKGPRKPVILDNERQIMVGNTNAMGNHLAMTSIDGIDMMQKPTTVQMNGGMIHTSPLRPNMTFTLDSIASCLPSQTNGGGPALIQNLYGMGMNHNKDTRSMTLNRRTSQLSGQHQQIMLSQQPAIMSNGQLNHSQSILTVASLTGPTTQVTNMPVLYGQMLPVVSEIPGAPIMQNQQPAMANHLGGYNTSSLSRGMNQRRFQQQ